MPKEYRKYFKSGIVGTVFASLLMAALIAFFGYSFFEGIQYWRNGISWDSAEKAGDYVHIDAEAVSNSFAGSDEDGTEYVFVTEPAADQNSYSDYVVKMTKAQYESADIQKLIDYAYTSDSGAKQPGAVRIKGIVEKDPDELKQYIYSSYPDWAPDVASDEETDSYLSDYLIDTTQKPAVGFNEKTIWPIAAAAFTVFLIIVLFRILKKQAERSAKNRYARQEIKDNPDYAQGLEETKMDQAVFYHSCSCCITPDYVISYADGLDVFRIDAIRELYGWDRAAFHPVMAVMFGAMHTMRTEHLLVAVLNDGTAHCFAAAETAIQLHSDIVKNLVTKNMTMTLGRNNAAVGEILPYMATFNAAQLNGFYGKDAIWQGRTV